MRNDLQNSPGNDSSFGVILSPEELERYTFLEKFYEQSKAQTKQSFKKTFILANKTIELQQKLEEKCKELRELREKNKDAKKQKELLDSQIKTLTQLLSQKQSQINGLTSKVQSMKNQILTQQQQVTTLKQQLKISNNDDQKNQIKQLYTELMEKNSLKEENQHFRELAKELNEKLIEINRALCKIKSEAQSEKSDETTDNQKQRNCERNNEKASIDDRYQSIIMESDCQIDMIKDNLSEVQNNIQILMRTGKIGINLGNGQNYEQQLQVIQAQNASLRKRVSRLQHEIDSEINLGVIRRKFRGIMGTENFRDNKEKIAQKWYELTQEYVKCINQEYDSAICGLFKEEDQYDEVIEQIKYRPKFQFSQFAP